MNASKFFRFRGALKGLEAKTRVAQADRVADETRGSLAGQITTR